MAWSGRAPIGASIRLLDTKWENPFPDLEISHLDLVSAMNEPGFFVVAITAELDPDRGGEPGPLGDGMGEIQGAARPKGPRPSLVL